MGVVEDLADDLAREALQAEKELDDMTLVDELAEVLLSTSATTQEAFLTAIRVRRAAENGRRYIENRLKAGKTG